MSRSIFRDESIINISKVGIFLMVMKCIFGRFAERDDAHQDCGVLGFSPRIKM